MNYIIITTIFPPNKIIDRLANMPDYQLIIVGDKKTPQNWHWNKVIFISVKKQREVGKYLKDILPFNHYCRKMIGYIYAINLDANLIIDTDDDNFPKENWGFPEFTGTYDYIEDNHGFINIYNLFTEEKIWPRGLPLRFINNKFSDNHKPKMKDCSVGIWQALADEDPDVDAIYRLTINKECYFSSREPVVLGKWTIAPFNSQNTATRKELFPLLYLPTTVTFRFTDILRGLVAQPIMWLYNYYLGFTEATVIQKRNPHDYFNDFLSEIPMYQYAEKVVELTDKVIRKSESLANNLFSSYEELVKKNIVLRQELNVLSAWLKDIDS